MATVKFNLDADEGKAVAAFLRLNETQRKTEMQFKRSVVTADKYTKMLSSMGKDAFKYNEMTSKMSLSSKQHEAAVAAANQKLAEQKEKMDGIKSSVSSVAGVYLSAFTAIDLVTKAIRFQNEELDKASQRTRSSEFSLASLSQLAGGDAGEMRRLVDEAKKTSVGAGIDLSQAAKLQFNLESFGIGKDRQLFADLVGTVEDPGALAEAAVTLQSAFGKKETGSIRAILNKGLAASATSKTTLNSLLTNAAQIAPGVAEIGGSDEEALSALAILAKARKSPEQAGTEIQALTKVMLKQGLGGMGLFAGIGAIDKKVSGMSDEKKLKFFGDVEGFKAFSTLTQSEKDVFSAYNATNAGNVVGANDQVAGAIRVRRSIPEIASVENLRQREQALGQTRADTFAVGENKSLALLQAIEQASINKGESPFTRFMRTSAAEAAKFFGASDKNIAGAAASVAANGSTEDAREFMKEIAGIMAGAVKEGIAQAAKQQPRLSRNNGMVE